MKVKKVGESAEQEQEKSCNDICKNHIIRKETSIEVGKESKTKYYVTGGVLIIIIVVLLYILFFQKSNETDFADKTRQEVTRVTSGEQKEKQITPPVDNSAKTNINGTYWGTIKDGTRFYLYISNFDGKNFNGFNKIYWKKYPDGLKTNYTGTYDYKTKQIEMLEDPDAKGAGKFIGTVSESGSSIHGTWYRYSDNGSFTWNLEKSDEEAQ